MWAWSILGFADAELVAILAWKRIAGRLKTDTRRKKARESMVDVVTIV